MKTKNAGWTLIELTIIIIIIGILSAVAIPKYITSVRTARLNSIAYLVGSLYSTLEVVHSAFELNGGVSPVVLENTQTVQVVTTSGLNYGAPKATALGIGIAAYYNGFVVTYTAAPNIATFTLAPNCTVTYTEATGLPAVGVTTGC